MVDLSRDVDDLLTPNCIALKDIDSSYTFLTSDYNFKVLSFNIRSIHQYFNEFLVILHRSKVKLDLIVLTECWLSENIIIPQIPGYNSYQTQKYINKSGGVVVYVRDSWNAVVQESSCLDTINIPTRGDACLDHMFVRDPRQAIAVVCTCDITDHHICIIGLSLRQIRPNMKRYRIKTNDEAIINDLNSVNWANVIDNKDVNDTVQIFMDTLEKIIKENSKKICYH
ncbi:unnamed protein product [Euphydryas editha]|uniref:Uncharacterized protein n=1 Tax=Euphydryas editha TaxID=104508 RepID=A0AAU9UDD6_EUPED|nr:unnamed protein product [Euphydryas editha]